MSASHVVIKSKSASESYEFTWRIENFSNQIGGLKSPVFTPSAIVPLKCCIELKFFLLMRNECCVSAEEVIFKDRAASYKNANRNRLVNHTKFLAILQICSTENVPAGLQITPEVEFQDTNGCLLTYIDGCSPRSYSVFGVENRLLSSTTIPADFRINREFCEYLPSNDIVVLKCNFKLFGHMEITKSNVDLIRTHKEDSNSLSSDYETLFRSKIFSDLEINVGNEVFSVHRSILASRSPVFKCMLENTWSECETNSVTINDVNSDIFKVFLEYLYGGVLKDKSYHSVKLLYSLSDRYDVNSLKMECHDILLSQLSIETVCEILLLSYLHDDGDMKEKCINFAIFYFSSINTQSQWKSILEKFPALASEVFSSMNSLFTEHAKTKHK